MNDESQTTNVLNAKIELIDELIKNKSSQLETMTDNLKRFEGFSTGSTETANKVEEFIKKQKNDLKELAQQEKIPQEIRNFTDSVIHAAQVFAKKAAEENEKLYFIKQGEVLFLKQEIEKLLILRKNHEIALENAKKKASEAEITLEAESLPVIKEEPASKEQPSQRIRKDKNPNTRVGRTALRVAEARRKSTETSKTLLENVSKKRGRKPKAK